MRQPRCSARPTLRRKRHRCYETVSSDTPCRGTLRLRFRSKHPRTWSIGRRSPIRRSISKTWIRPITTSVITGFSESEDRLFHRQEDEPMKSKLLVSLALALSCNCHAAIIFPKASEGGQQIAYEDVKLLLQQTPGFLSGAPVEELTIACPHQNYNANPQDVASGNLLSAAKAATGR